MTDEMRAIMVAAAEQEATRQAAQERGLSRSAPGASSSLPCDSHQDRKPCLWPISSPLGGQNYPRDRDVGTAPAALHAPEPLTVALGERRRWNAARIELHRAATRPAVDMRGQFARGVHDRHRRNVAHTPWKSRCGAAWTRRVSLHNPANPFRRGIIKSLILRHLASVAPVMHGFTSTRRGYEHAQALARHTGRTLHVGLGGPHWGRAHEDP